jgi:hypothetical protein
LPVAGGLSCGSAALQLILHGAQAMSQPLDVLGLRRPEIAERFAKAVGTASQHPVFERAQTL